MRPHHYPPPTDVCCCFPASQSARVPGCRKYGRAGAGAPETGRCTDTPPSPSFLYSLARFLGDYQAIKRGRIGQRIANKLSSTLSGRTAQNDAAASSQPEHRTGLVSGDQRNTTLDRV